MLLVVAPKKYKQKKEINNLYISWQVKRKSIWYLRGYRSIMPDCRIIRLNMELFGHLHI